jgi:glycosyltransferase involved in cell wall biosynthesis
MRLSVIIANHNYCDFVGAAIESALAVDWSDKEVIVVDDESTDDSRGVIEGFSGRVTAYFRSKSNQLGAHRFGFERSTGDVIIFLDSDDLLEPEVMKEVAKVWRPGVSKVQFRMNLIDAAGAQLGSAIPQFPPQDDPEKLRRGYLRTTAYTTPPGSGNTYSRDFVRVAFAVPSAIPQSDAVLLTLAPILGDVLTLRKPLARYRIHPASYGGMGSLDAVKFRTRLEQDVERGRLLATVSQRLGLPAPRNLVGRSPNHLQYRLASYLIEPTAHPFPGDTLLVLFCRLVWSATRSAQMPLRDRLILVAWAIACAAASRNYRRSLILWRFSATSRPAVIRTLLGGVSSLRSARLPNRTGPNTGKSTRMKA